MTFSPEIKQFTWHSRGTADRSTWMDEMGQKRTRTELGQREIIKDYI